MKLTRLIGMGVVALVAALSYAPVIHAAAFTVNSTGDGADADLTDGLCQTSTGQCTLRAAIQQANATPGPDMISFNIPGPAPHSIRPASPALPAITESVVIDATTEPGFRGTPVVELDGSVSGGIGLRLRGDNITVRGLAINRFSTGIELWPSDDSTITGNFIGTDVTGTLALANRNFGINLVGSHRDIIGGVSPSERNLISGNGWGGIQMQGGASENRVIGNFIGTDITGARRLGNLSGGVGLITALNNQIGGALPGEGNVISGNQGGGITIQATATAGSTDFNTIQGNRIGTDVSGRFPIGNLGNGIRVVGASNISIGGDAPGAGNLISGNFGNGIQMIARDSSFGTTTSSGNTVQGNFIGVNAAGTAALPNTGSGIAISDGVAYSQIGGSSTAARNVISGNVSAGIRILGSGTTAIVVKGNTIGLSADGLSAIGNTSAGIYVDSTGQTIGGVEPGEGNTIAANRGSGIAFDGVSATQNTVKGNVIGLQTTTGINLGNLGAGIQFTRGASGNFVGGVDAGAGNQIMNNGRSAGRPGIFVDALSRFDRISGNSITNNVGLGIDLEPYGSTPNDSLDADDGANRLQNFPTITAVTGASVEGRIETTPDTLIRVEVFASTTCDPSGFGEGQTFLGFADVVTDGSGAATFTLAFATPQPVGTFITTTATDARKAHTSEFSRCETVNVALALIARVADEVNRLVAQGALDKDTGGNLIGILDKAVQLVAVGESKQAVEQMTLFIDEVQKLVSSGQLSDLDGQNLTKLANSVVTVLKQ